MKKEFIKRHDDGSLWAKGKTVDDVPEGYWEWFRKDGARCAPAIFNVVNRLASGPPTTRMV